MSLTARVMFGAQRIVRLLSATLLIEDDEVVLVFSSDRTWH